jgi:hypothetical protein
VALSSDVKKQTKPEELEELIEAIEKLLDRTKVLYEQYFMGIQKVAPMQLHRDIERRVREVTQMQIRNTGLRFRFGTLCQKFGSYNTYWKRTLREIEQGRYVRDLVRVKRKADALGADLPDELLIKLPKLVQDRIRRDRARMAERAERTSEPDTETDALQKMALSPEPHVKVQEISEKEVEALFSDGDLDMDGLFNALTAHEQAGERTAPPPSAPPPVRAREVTAAAAPAEEAQAEPAEEAQAEEPEPASPPSAVSAPKAVTIPLPKGISLRKLAPAGEATFRVPPPPGMSRAGTAPPAKPAPKPEPPEPPPRPMAARTTPARPPPTPPPRIVSPRRPPALVVPDVVPPPGMNDRQCRELYARYVKARQMVGDKTDDVTYEKLVTSLTKQASAIMVEHKARGVEFQVVVRGDRVVLKAKPLKPDKPDK